MTLSSRASSDTLLGQLQRGLGRGFLAAPGDARAADALLECIDHDPRWDRQIESRGRYYAELALLLHVPAEAISRGLDKDQSLSAGVLSELAVRGRQDAMATLRDAVHGDAWVPAVEALTWAQQRYGQDLVGSRELAAIASRDAGEVSALVRRKSWPWEAWAEQEPRLAHVVESARPVASAGQPPVQELATMTTSELLGIAELRIDLRIVKLLTNRRDDASVAAMIEAARGAETYPRQVAFRVLGRQRNIALVDDVDRFFDSEAPQTGEARERVARLYYMENLPSEHTLPRARRWLGRGGHGALAAERILARHAEPQDRQIVESTLASSLSDETVYRACSMVEALEQIGDPRSAELLAHVFAWTPYAYARHLVLDALDASGAELGQELAREALWDCEVSARRSAAEMVHLDPGTTSRLKAMRDDPFEEPDLLATVAPRLD